MKKIIFILLAAVLTSFLSSPVFAQDSMMEATPQATPSVALSPTPTPVDYQLPYPGILPTNPFYKLKTLRDRVIGFLISDPIKKVEFDLLQADKRLNAGVYLSQSSPKDETDISDIISKGNNYFQEAITQEHLAKQQGNNVTDVNQQLYTSLLKHEQVLHQMMQNASPSLKQSLQQEYNRTTQFQKMVSPTMAK